MVVCDGGSTGGHEMIPDSVPMQPVAFFPILPVVMRHCDVFRSSASDGTLARATSAALKEPELHKRTYWLSLEIS